MGNDQARAVSVFASCFHLFIPQILKKPSLCLCFLSSLALLALHGVHDEVCEYATEMLQVRKNERLYHYDEEMHFLTTDRGQEKALS